MILEDSVSSGKLRPKTKGEILYINYLPHQEKYIVFDSFGNLYLLFKSQRRWKKIIIFQAKR